MGKAKTKSIAFNTIYGQERPKKIVENALKQGRLAQSYLFYGPPGVGKEMMAFELAKAVNCLDTQGNGQGCGVCNSCKKILKFQHPDVRYLFPVPSSLKPQEVQDVIKEKALNPSYQIEFDRKASISIDTIREIKKEAAYRVFEGRYKIFIIRQAEAMTLQASNALLKVLEEPPPQMLLVLTSAHSQSLLPTILSRCQQIRFDLLEEAVIETILKDNFSQTPGQARVLSRISGGSMKNVFEIQEEDIDLLREQVWKVFGCTRRKDMLRNFDVVEELASGRNIKQLEKVFKMLQGCFHDLLMIKTNQRERVINLEQIAPLDKVSNEYSADTITASVQEIENALNLIPRNVNLSLITFNLIQRLAEFYQGKKA